MAHENQAVVEFLNKRRSCPIRALTAPYPEDHAIEALLSSASRCPDHGALAPWRFIVLNQGALARVSSEAQAICDAREISGVEREKAQRQFEISSFAVAVISSPKLQSPIPEIEQVYSAGAVCLSLVNAALAAGWGANWISGWISHDAEFRKRALALEEHEKIAGFVHIGSCDMSVPDRARPDVKQLTTYL